MSTTTFPLAEGPPDHNIICKGLSRSLGGKGGEEVINEDEEKDWEERGALRHTHGQGLGDGGGAHTQRSLLISEECTDPAHQSQRYIATMSFLSKPACQTLS